MDRERGRTGYGLLPIRGTVVVWIIVRQERDAFAARRGAPAYDFLSAPHAGRLRYERYPLGLTGSSGAGSPPTRWKTHG